MSDFKVERQAAIDAVQETRRMEIDVKLVDAGMGDQIEQIDIIGPDYFMLAMSDDTVISLTELRILSELFNTNAIETFLGDDFKLKISVRASEL